MVSMCTKSQPGAQKLLSPLRVKHKQDGGSTDIVISRTSFIHVIIKTHHYNLIKNKQLYNLGIFFFLYNEC